MSKYSPPAKKNSLKSLVELCRNLHHLFILYFCWLGQWKWWCSKSGRETSIGVILFLPIAIIKIMGIDDLIIVNNWWYDARLSLQPLVAPSPLNPTSPTPCKLCTRIYLVASSSNDFKNWDYSMWTPLLNLSNDEIE